MGKRDKTVRDSNYDFGKRLSYCRDKKNLTQEKLAEMIDVSPNYISMLETGERDNPSKKVIRDISKVLGVSSEYLTCQTNMIKSPNLHYATDDYIKRDTCLLRYIEFLGYELRFGVIPLYDGIKPREVELNICGIKKKVTDYVDLERQVTLDDIENVSFFDFKCVLKDGKTKCEAVIRTVYLNGNAYNASLFVGWLNHTQSLIDYSVANIQSYEWNRIQESIGTEKIQSTIESSRGRSID